MIFVTVGTHEQQQNRLVQAIDQMKQKIDEDIIIQSGYSDSTINRCDHKKMYSYQEMNELAENSRIMITHGGPASIFLAYSYGKIPIVVPRQKKFGEHIDDHQVHFCRRLQRQQKVIMVEDIEELYGVIIDFDNIVRSMNVKHNFNTANFVKKFESIIESL